MNIYLFKYLNFLLINGVLNEIQMDLFSNFLYLKKIDFQLDNLRGFFHASNNQWMSVLNAGVSININDHNLDSIKDQAMLLRFLYLSDVSSYDHDYEYPNEDLCLFRYFPHSSAVFPFIVPGKRLACTCTIYWLHLYANIYRQIIELNTTLIICDETFNSSTCDLEKWLTNCDATPVLDKESFFKRINDTDILFLIKWLQSILLTILQPLLCGLAIVNNLINLIVIKNKSKKKEFNETMYRFIEINSIFNIFYCLCMSMKLINTCIFDEESGFCSSVYTNDSSQYFKIIFIFFLGNSFKLSSNISYLLFSVSRLVLITIEKNLTKKEFKFNRYILYFGAIFLASCFLSVFKLFQYELNVEQDFRKDFSFETLDEFYCESNGVDKNYKCNLFKFFKIFNSILNDILLVILNLIVDAILLRNFHRHLDNKSRHIIDMDHHKNIQKSKKKLNRMIFFNGLLYVFSHLPEFVTTLLLVIYSRDISRFCNFNFSCDLVSEKWNSCRSKVELVLSYGSQFSEFIFIFSGSEF
jgi:hypothetical protein